MEKIKKSKNPRNKVGGKKKIRIIKLRIKYKYSVAKIAEMVGVSNGTVSNILRSHEQAKNAIKIQHNGKELMIYKRHSNGGCTGCIFNGIVEGLNCLMAEYMKYQDNCNGYIWKSTTTIKKKRENKNYYRYSGVETKYSILE